MENNAIWLIHLKASLGLESSINFDGSEHVIAVGVVQAQDLIQALAQLKEYLNNDHMDILDFWKCERYDATNFQDETEENREIKKAVGFVLDRGQPVLACGVTSEALEDDRNA